MTNYDKDRENKWLHVGEAEWEAEETDEGKETQPGQMHEH